MLTSRFITSSTNVRPSPAIATSPTSPNVRSAGEPGTLSRACALPVSASENGDTNSGFGSAGEGRVAP